MKACKIIECLCEEPIAPGGYGAIQIFKLSRRFLQFLSGTNAR
jgi:hypothetical protein